MKLHMDEKVIRRFDAYRRSGLTWHPETGGRRPLIAWDDDVTTDIGPDPDGSRFRTMADQMMTGRYYPAEVIIFHRQRTGPMSPGERILQQAFVLGVSLWSMVEIFAAEQQEDFCRIGYVTTSRHHGRGVWEAVLTRTGARLSLRVKSTSGPQSAWFWLGLPIARSVQLRARKRGIENLRQAF